MCFVNYKTFEHETPYYFVRTGAARPAAQVVHCTQLGEGGEGGFHRDGDANAPLRLGAIWLPGLITFK